MKKAYSFGRHLARRAAPQVAELSSFLGERAGNHLARLCEHRIVVGISLCGARLEIVLT